MAQASSRRQSRKRRRAAAGSPPRVTVPAPAPAERRPRLATRPAPQRDPLNWQSMLGAYGERPTSVFGAVPVSEVAIFVGAVGAAIGFFGHHSTALVVGLIVCALGVAEVTAREHFSGYRSHAALLAALPAVAIGIGLVALIGHGSIERGLSGPDRSVLLVIVPLFGAGFWLLRKRFRTARQARVVRPPGP